MNQVKYNENYLSDDTCTEHVIRLYVPKSRNIRGLSKKFVEFVNTNKTTIPIAFKFVYN